MPKFIREKPVFFIVPALVIIIGAVFLYTHYGQGASEFDREASPAGYSKATMNNVVAHFNDNKNAYYVWTAGQTEEGNGLIFVYDGVKFLWSAQELSPGARLNGIDMYYDEIKDQYTLWAVGNQGYILKYDRWIRGGETYEEWGYLCPGCSEGVLPDGFDPSIGNWTTSNLVDVGMARQESTGNILVWAVSENGEVFYSNNDGITWSSFGAFSWGINAIDVIDENLFWVAGDGGHYARWNGSWTSWQIGTADLRDISFADATHGWMPVDAQNYYYYNSVTGAWASGTTGLGVTSNINGVASTRDSRTGDYHVWFVGDQGRIIFSQDNTNWVFQETEVTIDIRKAFAVNPTHVWSVGAESLILKISPGNTTGWGYVGADNCTEVCSGSGCVTRDCVDPAGETATRPVGWVSFNCANQTVCDTTTFSYGVNIKKKLEAGQCSEDPNKACLSEADCIGTCDNFGECSNAIQDKDVAALSGYGWFGKDDIYELPPGVACDYVPGDGYTYCSNNHSVICVTDNNCACAFNFASCYSSGWLSFDREDTGNPPDCPYKIGDATCDDYVSSNSYKTPCNKIVVSGQPEDYIIATFDYATYALEGWGRFMLGTCLNDNVQKACFQNNDCVENYCYYGQASGAEGWIKLRGGSHDDSPDAFVSDYMPCNACVTVDPDGSAGEIDDDDGNEYITCEICDGFYSGEKYMCNNCGTEGSLTCGTGRCSGNLSKVCIVGSNHNYCDVVGDGTCVETGYCIDGPLYQPCTNKDDCNGTDGSCYINENWSGNTCNTCDFCDQYGVSLDINAGDWYGYAYSEDFGWIDMSAVGQYNTAWIRANYGDIYARGNVGSWQTTPPPGYNYSLRDCNASYLILAGGSVINFCSDALTSIGTTPSFETPTDINPYVVEGYRAFNFPRQETEEFSPHSIIGTINYNYLVDQAEDKGTVFSGEADESDFADPVDLGGKIYHVKKTGDLVGQEGNLTINRTGGFIIDSGAIDGSGLIVVDGDLVIESDIKYNEGAVITKIEQIPSLGFYVKGDIIVDESVTQIVGTFYTENSFITLTTGSVNTDIQLKVDGVIAAGIFDLRRKYKGTINIPQPAEIITYDGRIQLNPPPGFQDLTSALPKVRQTNP